MGGLGSTGIKTGIVAGLLCLTVYNEKYEKLVTPLILVYIEFPFQKSGSLVRDSSMHASGIH